MTEKEANIVETKFLLFRKDLLDQIKKFEDENDCKIIFLKNKELIISVHITKEL